MPRLWVSAFALTALLVTSGAQAADYSEDPSDIQNPERGFYGKGVSKGLLSTEFAKTASGTIDDRHAAAFVIYYAAQQAPEATATSGADSKTTPMRTTINAQSAGSPVIDIITQGEAGSFNSLSAGQTELWDRACKSSGSAGSTLSVAVPGTLELGWSHNAPR